MKNLATLLFFGISSLVFSQTLSQKLDNSVKHLFETPGTESANLSFFVANAKGEKIYGYNAEKGLSTASTQKIFTAGFALEMLGESYRYTTTFARSGEVVSGKLNGNLYIESNGDPTLGSWRYEETKPAIIRGKLFSALKNAGIREINGDLLINDGYFDFQNIPGGWPWNDIGNYYGAGVWGVNWSENQFDMEMKGKDFQKMDMEMPDIQLVNEVQTRGSTDQSIIYTAPHSSVVYVNGALPDKKITISGAMPDPPMALGNEIKGWLKDAGISFNGKIITASNQLIKGEKFPEYRHTDILFTHHSPELGKIVYWFLRKSINMYGETFIKTIAKPKMGVGSFSTGVPMLKNFWESRGIPVSQINFADGSGLSPQNYVSAKAEVQALLYAKKQPWFNTFFEGFPVHENGMKMKSGTMKNVKSYAGIQGNYVFSIIINNYQGADAGEALQKILNILK